MFGLHEDIITVSESIVKFIFLNVTLTRDALQKFSFPLISRKVHLLSDIKRDLTDEIPNDSLHASLLDNLNMQTDWVQIKPYKMSVVKPFDKLIVLDGTLILDWLQS